MLGYHRLLDFLFSRHPQLILLYLNLPFLLDNHTLFGRMWCIFVFRKVCFVLLWKKLCLLLLCCHLFLALIFLTNFHTTCPICLDTTLVSLGVYITISHHLHPILIPPSHKAFALEIFCWIDFSALVELWIFLQLPKSYIVWWIACLFLLGYYALVILLHPAWCNFYDLGLAELLWTTQQLLSLATRKPARDLCPPLEEVLPPLEIAHSVRPPLEIAHWCFLAVKLHSHYCVFIFVLVPFVLQPSKKFLPLFLMLPFLRFHLSNFLSLIELIFVRLPPPYLLVLLWCLSSIFV